MQMAPVNLIETHSLSFLKVISVKIQENKILVFENWHGFSIIIIPTKNPKTWFQKYWKKHSKTKQN